MQQVNDDRRVRLHRALDKVLDARGVVHEKCASPAEVERYMDQPFGLKGAVVSGQAKDSVISTLTAGALLALLYEWATNGSNERVSPEDYDLRTYRPKKLRL